MLRGNWGFGVQVVLQEKWKQRAVDSKFSRTVNLEGSIMKLRMMIVPAMVLVWALAVAAFLLGHQQGVQSIYPLQPAAPFDLCRT